VFIHDVILHMFTHHDGIILCLLTTPLSAVLQMAMKFRCSTNRPIL
jgi:hypothetical protein